MTTRKIKSLFSFYRTGNIIKTYPLLSNCIRPDKSKLENAEVIHDGICFGQSELQSILYLWLTFLSCFCSSRLYSLPWLLSLPCYTTSFSKWLQGRSRAGILGKRKRSKEYKTMNKVEAGYNMTMDRKFIWTTRSSVTQDIFKNFLIMIILFCNFHITLHIFVWYGYCSP